MKYRAVESFFCSGLSIFDVIYFIKNTHVTNCILSDCYRLQILCRPTIINHLHTQ